MYLDAGTAPQPVSAATGEQIGIPDECYPKYLIVEWLWFWILSNRGTEMQIHLGRCEPELTPELFRQLERTLLFWLGRFSGDVRTVVVEVSHRDTAGPGSDECVITVRTEWGARIRIQELAESFTMAIGRAADRAGRALERQTRLREEHGL